MQGVADPGNDLLQENAPQQPQQDATGQATPAPATPDAQPAPPGEFDGMLGPQRPPPNKILGVGGGGSSTGDPALDLYAKYHKPTAGEWLHTLVRNLVVDPSIQAGESAVTANAVASHAIASVMKGMTLDRALPGHVGSPDWRQLWGDFVTAAKASDNPFSAVRNFVQTEYEKGSPQIPPISAGPGMQGVQETKQFYNENLPANAAVQATAGGKASRVVGGLVGLGEQASVLGAAGLGPMASWTIAMADTGASAQYFDAKAHGATDEDATKSWAMALGANAAAAVATAGLFKAAEAMGGPPLAQILLAGPGAGAAGMELQNAATNGIAKAMYDSKRPIFEGGLDAGAFGALFGLVGGAVGQLGKISEAKAIEGERARVAQADQAATENPPPIQAPNRLLPAAGETAIPLPEKSASTMEPGTAPAEASSGPSPTSTVSPAEAVPAQSEQAAEAPTAQNEAVPAAVSEPARSPAVTSGETSAAAPTSTGEPESVVTSTKNAKTEEQRATRAMAPAEEEATREFGTVWEDARAKAEADPTAPERLVEDLVKNPRPVSDLENAMVLRRQIDLETQHDALSKQIVDALADGDQEKLAELRPRFAWLTDQLENVYDATKAIGRETARGLNARKMLADQKYTLARTMQEVKVAKGVSELAPEDVARIDELYRRVQEKQADLERILKEESALRPKPAEKPAPESKQPGKVLQFISSEADKARARIKARGARAMAGLDPIDFADRVIVGVDYLAKDISAFADWSKSMLSEFGEAIKPHLQAIYDAAKSKFAVMQETPQQKAQATRYEGIATKLQGKIASGDFSPEPKRQPIPMSPRGQKAYAAVQAAREQIDLEVEKARLENRTPFEKTADTLVKMRRGFLLSSWHTFAKLLSAGTERLIQAPVEEAVGGLISKAIPSIAEKAPIQGGFSVEAQAKAITEGFTKGMSDAAEKIKTGKSDLDRIWGGRSRAAPRDVVDMLGSLHAASKAPVVRAAFTQAFQKTIEWGIRNNMDVSDPVFQMRAGLDAYKEANRSVFMQDNRVVDGFNRWLRALEQKNPQTGEVPAMGKLGATAGRVLFPIVKIPTNFVAETMEHATGLVSGSVRVAQAFRAGTENLKPAQAEITMRLLKKGSVGAAALLAGYFAPDHFGGYYQPGERREGDLKAGSIGIGSLKLPSLLLHNPLLEAAQIGATIRRVADSRLSKKSPDEQGIGAGMIAGALGLLEETPFVREPAEIGKIITGRPEERQQAEGQLAKGLVVPAGVADIARALDSEERKPTTVLEHIKEGIPGLRQTLPIKTPPKIPIRKTATPGMPRK